MRADEDDAVFWERLAAMPIVEAEIELTSRRAWASEQRIDAYHRGRHDLMRGFDLSLTRINAEIKRLSILRHETNWRDAVRTVLGEEAYVAVRAHIMAMDPRA